MHCAPEPNVVPDMPARDPDADKASTVCEEWLIARMKILPKKGDLHMHILVQELARHLSLGHRFQDFLHRDCCTHAARARKRRVGGPERFSKTTRDYRRALQHEYLNYGTAEAAEA